ncbi:MAG: hypothetical protein ACR2PR_02665 [Pseudohongiellaceae bacterium]
MKPLTKLRKYTAALSIALLALLLSVLPMASVAQEFVWAPDFPVGSNMIEISAEDQNGNVQTFDSLKGEKGLVFMLSRSFDW